MYTIIFSCSEKVKIKRVKNIIRCSIKICHTYSCDKALAQPSSRRFKLRCFFIIRICTWMTLTMRQYTTDKITQFCGHSTLILCCSSCMVHNEFIAALQRRFKLDKLAAIHPHLWNHPLCNAGTELPISSQSLAEAGRFI